MRQTAARLAGGKNRLAKTVGAGLAGSMGGVLTGNVINEVIAAGNRPKLPTTSEYTQGVQ